MFRLYNQYKIRINYKSGNQIDLLVYDYSLKSEVNGDAITSLKMHLVNTDILPLNLNVEAIETVWRIGGKRLGLLGDKEFE